MARVVMNHTGFVVKDLEVSRKFYMEGLGLEELRKFDIQSHELGLVVGYDNARIYASMLAGADGHMLEIIQYVDPPTLDTADPILYERRRVGGTHLAFFVEDSVATWKRLCRMGGTALNDPVEVLPGMWECYMQDPDGNWIEITSDASHNQQQFVIRQIQALPD